jgi:hypothetical protein
LEDPIGQVAIATENMANRFSIDETWHRKLC